MLREYEGKFGKLSTEIERLNQVLRSKALECEDLQMRLRVSQE